MRRTTIAAAIAGMTLAGSSLAVSANAAVTNGNASQCAGGASTHVCLFWNSSFSQPKSEYSSAAASLGSMSDQASSIANNRNYRAYFWKDTNYLGSWNICLSRNQKNDNLPNNRNDEISSVNFASNFQTC